MKLAERVAIVTGSGSGIGRATARLLAQEGARLGVFDVDEKGGRETVSLIEADGGKALFVRCDVTREAEIEAGVQQVLQQFGRLDILHANAGVGGQRQTPIDELDLADWNRILTTHLTGYFLCAKHVVKHFKQQRRGVIVATASTAGLVGLPFVHAYGAAKHGIVGLTKEMALELAEYGIRVNAVAPGAIDTPMLRGGLPELPSEQLESIRQRHPLGHPGRPENIAHGVLYLVSDEAEFVTGTVLSIDGGYVAR